jgi:hypothetical protein
VPSDRQKRAEQQRKRRQARLGASDTPPGEAPPAKHLPLRTPADALRALEEQMNLARADATASPQVRARTVAYIVMTGVKVMEVGQLAERLAAVEAALKLGPGG